MSLGEPTTDESDRIQKKMTGTPVILLFMGLEVQGLMWTG
jgi:hypothetical protein